MLAHRVHDRVAAAALVRSVAAWDEAGLYVTGLHAGDLGWALRHTDEDLAGTLHGWLPTGLGPAVTGAGPGVVRRAADDVAGRVTAQRNGFEGSTFDEPSWRRMADGPGYDPGLDLVAVTDDGEAAAVATAWPSVPGGTALLEPVATHRAFRRSGWGHKVVTAACAAAQQAGASGISVWTPAANEAAVAAYRAAGFRPVETVQALTWSR